MKKEDDQLYLDKKEHNSDSIVKKEEDQLYLDKKQICSEYFWLKEFFKFACSNMYRNLACNILMPSEVYHKIIEYKFPDLLQMVVNRNNIENLLLQTQALSIAYKNDDLQMIEILLQILSTAEIGNKDGVKKKLTEFKIPSGILTILQGKKIV